MMKMMMNMTCGGDWWWLNDGVDLGDYNNRQDQQGWWW